ncbi:hypothetical protein V1515DRAFT_400305 [Lipomyces mesembrius]
MTLTYNVTQDSPRGNTGGNQPLPRWWRSYFWNRARGHEIDLPDGELFNIYLAIAKMLRASGAGKSYQQILQDEDDFNEGVVEDRPSAARISALLSEWLALQGAQAAADSAESRDILHQVMKGIILNQSHSVLLATHLIC